MSMLKEFKTFAVRGNVVDMAVGIIIGAAFGKIVSSLVADVITPPLGFLLGGERFRDLAIELKAATPDAPAVLLAYGKFLQATFDFIIVAFAVFFLVKGINRLKERHAREQEQKPAPPPPTPPRQEQLLAEIRDLLKKSA